jgi:hypothetical protein
VQQFGDIDTAIDAGDEKFLRFSFGKQVQAAFDAEASSGEHDDRIGWLVGQRHIARDRRGKAP